MLDYQQNPARQLGGFAVETLAPFDDDQVTQFVEAWYAELAATDRQMVGTAANLQAAIGTRGELRRLAANPLLLTMMAVVHAGRGKLPDARAQLYAECIDLLLLRWRKEPGQPDVLERLKLPQFTASELLALMAELGFKAHEGALRDTANRDEPADLSREQVLQTLERTFARYTVGDPARRAALIDLVLREIAERNGLLLKRSAEQGEVFAFPHRTFQEFLAGYYLKNRPNRLALWLERAPHLHWHEALTLMVGYLAIQDHERESPLAFVAKLLEHSMAERALAGELLHQIGRENAIEYDPTCVLPTGVWGAARKTLLAALSSDAPVAERNRAGLALGLVCYGRLETLDRPGVYVALPDPRLPLSVLGPQAAASPAWHTVMARYWCPIPARPFGFGDDRKDKLSQVTLEEGYQIGPYPITNADYARFVAAGGYDTTQPWWTPNGREYMQREKRRKPDFWTDLRFNNPLQPVVGVSWYEAAAYCRWLTPQGHAQGWLPADQLIRLPTSLEWERAARGTDKRRYPWGDAEPTLEHANYDTTGIGATSPVGCFPHGRAGCGAEDMAGNIWEWLATPNENDQQIEPEEDFTQGDQVLLTLSGFNTRDVVQMSNLARGRVIPFINLNYLGFRLVQSRART